MGKEQELILAAQTGNLVQIDKILGQRAKKPGPLQSIRKSVGPNCQDTNGYTPLHHAALNGKRDAVEALLKYEASTNIPDFAGSYPLHLAAWNGHADVVELLLNRGPSRANVNEQNNNNETALHLACQYGHNKVIVVLLECHGDPYLRNLKNESPLDLAAQYGRLDAVNCLLLYFPALAKKTLSTHSPIHLASRNGHYNIVKSLIEKGMPVNLESDDGTPLHIAALYGKSNIVKLLLQSGVDINKHNKQGCTVMDLLSSNPSQRSREITACIYTHIQNEEQSSFIGGKSRSLSEAASVPSTGYDAIPPPRPISEFGNVYTTKVQQSSHYDEVPPPLSLSSRGAANDIRNTSEAAVTDAYDTVPSRPFRENSFQTRQPQFTRQTSYDEVPKPRAANAPTSLRTRMPSSPASYDFVPPPRQAPESNIPVESTYGLVNRPQSLTLGSSQYQVPVNNSAQPVNSIYGVVNLGRNQSSTMPAKVPSKYALLNYSGNGLDQSQPVNSVYGVVQPSMGGSGHTSEQAGPQYPVSTERQNYHATSSWPAGEQSQGPPVSPRKNALDRSNSVPAPDNTYEFVELPRVGSLSRGSQSNPISIPSQHRSLPRTTDYDTVVSPPSRRADPIGAAISPDGNFGQKREEDRKEGDGLARGSPEIRSDPEGAKKRDVQSPSTHRDVPDYENVVLPNRTGSMSSGKETVYENMPAITPPSYEYNIPRSYSKTSAAVASCTSSEEDRSSPVKDMNTSQASSASNSYSGSPSSERRTTDYENVELPFRSPSSRGSPSSQRSRNAYEILPPHILHAPIEPGSPKPDAQGRIRPPIPKPYRDARKSLPDAQNVEDDYCTLREALSEVTSPTREYMSPDPPFSPPSPSTARDVLLHAFAARTDTDSGGSDESSRRSSGCGDAGTRPRTLKYENVMFDKPSPSSSSGESGGESRQGQFTENFRLSSVSDGPMNEYEEWKKIERFMNILGEEIVEERKEAEQMTSEVGKWLNGFNLGLYESYLLANGFDDLEFLAGGILEEQDLLEMGVLDPDYRKTIIDHVGELSLPPRVGQNGFEPKTVEEWLNTLHLDDYLDIFHQKGYDKMDRIKQMWELEMESVLAIHTLGHRKRILASLPQVKRRDTMVVSAEDIKDRLAEIDVFGGEPRRDTLDMFNPSPGMHEWRNRGSTSPESTSIQQEEALRIQQALLNEGQRPQSYDQAQVQQSGQREPERPPRNEEQRSNQQQSQQQRLQQSDGAVPVAPPRRKKSKQKTANQDQKNDQSNIQRQPSLPSPPHWLHPPEALLKGNVNYTTRYLGSHFIKDVIGESSTIEACRKMRMSTQKLQKIPAVILSISVTGVRFIDARSRIAISSHYVHNISYCTQDLEDRSVLAYIAKDQKANAHYCHVFKANSPAISDEIVMTLGQAFELAFEQYSHAQYTSGHK
ncbi:ankyrin repeat and SAM domain-containing protein 1A-like [Dendronephthya gigantea]|uniref:ankyrin repeat and SAM domain-containing protein 1A-like n=1 Tax=Dendronephthya gigantea TaxID=151771 RepID=UPI00106D8098|nr:ankyrin repeat and SAM domain-containing protein 1A-like [Dendronephthya gigantea]